MHQVDIKELAQQLPTLLAAIAQGEEIILTAGQRPVAKLVKIESLQPDRQPGSAAGLFTLSSDFNEPLDHFDELYQ